MMAVMARAETEPRVPSTARARLFQIVRLLVVFVAYFLIFRVVDLSDVFGSVSEWTAWAFGTGVLLLLVQTALCTVRWRLLVPQDTPRPGFVRSFWAYMEGAFFNQVLPSTIGGDAIRVLRWRSPQMPAADAFATVLVDRISGATGAALLAGFASLLLLAHDVADYRTLAVLALSAAFLFGGLCFIALMRWPRLQGLLHYLDRMHPGLERVRRALVLGRRFLLSLGYSVVGHCLSGVAVYALARSLAVDLPLSLAIGITGVVILISMIPISLAGWGMREASFLTLLGPLGVSNRDAVLIGILFGLVVLVSALPGGLSLLFGWAKPTKDEAALALRA
jgi:glycosyltransferase 2 family protein